jgi:hypothetical protein
MPSSPPGNFIDSTVDHGWDAAGNWYLCGMWTDYGGGTQVWKYVGEGNGADGTGWNRVLHVPGPEGYYPHGIALAQHVGKLKIMFRSQDKKTIGGADIPGAVRFAPLKA